MEDIIALLSNNSYLILKESFEYTLIKSGVLDFYLPKEIDIDNPEVDSSKYLTWERYYTDLLKTITKQTPYAYKKDSLPNIYTKSNNARLILKVYDLDNFFNFNAEHTNLF